MPDKNALTVLIDFCEDEALRETARAEHARLQALAALAPALLAAFEWKGLHAVICKCDMCQLHNKTLAEAKQIMEANDGKDNEPG